MVEGCNLISVTILFSAFILSFYKGAKTFLFVLSGLIILHILNISRIIFLNIIFFNYQQFEKISHDYIFPAIIYGGMTAPLLDWIHYFALMKVEKAYYFY